jgi:hypothetical protein
MGGFKIKKKNGKKIINPQFFLEFREGVSKLKKNQVKLFFLL